MPILKRCDQPVSEALAFYNPLDAIVEHRPIIQANIKYWGRVGMKSMDYANPAVYITAREMVSRYTEALLDPLLFPASDAVERANTKEASRRNAIGLAGFTILFRRITKDPLELNDAVGTERRDVRFLADQIRDEEGYYLENRMHITHESAGRILPTPEDPDEWFFDGRLYVHRQIPATDQVSDQAKLNMMEHGVGIKDWELVTLTGSLASCHVEHPEV